MGLLRDSEILDWGTITEVKHDVKKNGIKQFANIYHKYKDVITSTKAVGEEIEAIFLKKSKNVYKLCCNGEKVINNFKFCSVEYGRYMIEMTSVVPYDENTVVDLEKRIIKRINKIYELIGEDEEILLLPCYPNFNFNHFYSFEPLKNDVTLSKNFPDNAITLHKRFSMLTKNIRGRRGKKIEGYIKVMADNNAHISVTDRYKNILFNEERSNTQTEIEVSNLIDHLNNDNYIQIDSMGQGMGCCGLQLTIQGHDIDKTRYMYDMLGILSPLLLRLSRGTPLAQGRLLSTETRWEMVEISVDCRTDEERGFAYMTSGLDDFYPYSSEIPKSRYSPIDLFISNNIRNLDEYNNTNVPINTDSYFSLVKEGVDDRMAKHIASLFVRDPVISYSEIEHNIVDDFENIQTSNWRSVRFKIPNLAGEKDLCGWKNELRSMDIQATAFENSAFIFFSYFLAHAVVKYNLNLYIPISYVDANFKRANKFIRSPSEFKSVLEEDRQKFYYRMNIDDIGQPIITEGTLKEIFLGSDDYKGLMYYVDMIISDDFYKNRKVFKRYMEFIKGRLSNKYISLADYIRKFVISHKEYNNDSVVNDSIIQDLIEKLIQIRKKNEVEYLLNN